LITLALKGFEENFKNYITTKALRVWERECDDVIYPLFMPHYCTNIRRQ